MKDKPGNKNPILARYLYERIRKENCPLTGDEIRKQTGGKNGVSKATVSNIRTGGGKYGVANDAATRLLRLWPDEFKTFDDLWHAAVVFDRQRRELRYPNLTRVVRENAATDRWRAPTIEAANALFLEADMTREEWTAFLDSVDSSILAALPARPKR